MSQIHVLAYTTNHQQSLYCNDSMRFTHVSYLLTDFMRNQMMCLEAVPNPTPAAAPAPPGPAPASTTKATSTPPPSVATSGSTANKGETTTDYVTSTSDSGTTTAGGGAPPPPPSGRRRKRRDTEAGTASTDYKLTDAQLVIIEDMV